MFGDSHTVGVCFLQAQLEGSKEPSTARDADAHEAELTEHLLPFPNADALLASQHVEDLLESLLAVFREFEGALDCVDDPAKDELAGGP